MQANIFRARFKSTFYQQFFDHRYYVHKYFSLRFNAFFFNTYFIYPNDAVVTLRNHEDADITPFNHRE